MTKNRIKGTKAETLHYLFTKKFRVPIVYYFTVKAWNKNQENILSNIIEKYKKHNYLAIRSSSLAEDTETDSMAGAFESILNVNTKNRDEIINSINTVIKSFDNNLENQVLIQPMVEDVAISGVVMTKSLDDGSPYYVINFDDTTGKTDTVTNGNSINKTVYVYNGFKEEDFDSPFLLEVLRLVRKLESYYKDLPLDVEFAVNKNKEVFLLQVRPITTTEKWKKEANKLIPERLPYLTSFVQQLMSRRVNIYGNKTLLGIMPDWNPAEMIGIVPHPLAMSLYRQLITKRTWSLAREKMGYKKMPAVELMVSLFGRAYIDVRNSMNSFLPEKLSPIISEKLINAYIERLEGNPYLHDKIEFEVVLTIYDFKFKENLQKWYPNLLNEEELMEFKDCLLEITQNAIENTKENTLNKSIEQIGFLKELQEKKLTQELITPFSISDHINTLINQCIKYGTIPFSITARHGFIAESLLRSAIACGAIEEERVKLFKRSVKTISSEMSEDFYNVCNNLLDKEKFIEKYGHLRPSSYDILSPSYKNREDLFNGDPQQPNHHDVFNLSEKERKSLNNLLKEHGFDRIDADDIFVYAAKAIKGREYQKFIFTNHLSEILEYVVKWGDLLGFSKQDLAMLTINEIKSVLFTPITNDVKKFFKSKIEKAKKSYDVANSFKINYLIRSIKDIYIAPVQRSAANFVGNKRIEEKIVFLTPYMKKIPQLEGKIICIEGADPGYDWIFSRNIAGLITKFGGANSHMAIRCAEYDLPAAIGCGEQPFDKILKADKVLLDCQGKRLESISM
jgi:antitoxin component of RelBE/YafQ-DinJ toxin-antitoxin module